MTKKMLIEIGLAYILVTIGLAITVIGTVLVCKIANGC